MKNNLKIAVIGGGASGLIAGAAAARHCEEVTLLERNEKLGKKLYITGKGRCNLTNACDTDEFFASVVRNPRFIYSAYSHFDNSAIIALVEEMGVKTKVERGMRVFPESDKSSDIIRALSKNLEQSGARIALNSHVTSVEREGDGFAITSNGERMYFDRVILATGGLSYQSTGSTGDGLDFAQALGHTVTPTRPSLVPLCTRETWPFSLTGLTLKNVELRAFVGKKRIYAQQGEMMFTHFGITGPLVLTLSALIADNAPDTRLEIDLKPALSNDMLDRRLLRDFSENQRRQFKNSLYALLPESLVSVIIELVNIDGEKCVSDITKQERQRLLETLKHLELTVKCTRGFDEAVITRGGVCVKEIDPSTMESKKTKGLYFCGEVIDIDALTGGFNLQLAFSTGFCAGESAALS